MPWKATNGETGRLQRPWWRVLAGKAHYTADETLTINELDLYITERVKSLTGGKHTPVR
ncbi:unnamed protein product, partial [marine sediment metagenome]